MNFIVTKEVGKLSKWLRILGFNCEYYSGDNPADLVIKALRDQRIILTRNSNLYKYKGLQIILLRSDFVEKQLENVIKKLSLNIDDKKRFTRCVNCNELLEEVDRDKVKGAVPGHVFETTKQFKRCPSCQRIFWRGSHWDMVDKFLKRIR